MVKQLKALGAKRVVLFGSLARGEVGKRSDVDLIVVLDAPGRFLDRLALVDEALRDRDVPLDALVYTSEEFAELSRKPEASADRHANATGRQANPSN